MRNSDLRPNFFYFRAVAKMKRKADVFSRCGGDITCFLYEMMGWREPLCVFLPEMVFQVAISIQLMEMVHVVRE